MALPSDAAKRRAKAEQLIYDTLDAADPSHTNSDYYKEKFAGMNDAQFYKFFEGRIPMRFHTSAFEVEPKMYEIDKAFKVLNVPLYEEINLPYLYRDSKGKPIKSKSAMVIYLHIKRLKQMVTKKTSISLSIAERDMHTGLLTGHSKTAKMSDREQETLAIPALYNTMDEFSRIRADAMKSKEEMYSIIATKGVINAGEINVEKDESLAKNMLYVYMLGANVCTNLIGEDNGYMNPNTIRNKQAQLEREY